LFDFPPQIIGIIAQSNGGDIANIAIGNTNNTILTSYLTTEPIAGAGLGVDSRNVGYKSADGKTIFWYCTANNISMQFNSLGVIYYYFAIG
jgi:hypothetical protein